MELLQESALSMQEAGTNDWNHVIEEVLPWADVVN